MEYAQTCIQLYNQLLRNGYSGTDVRQIQLTYDVTMRLFTGIFVSSGKTFLEHSVGTAAVLGAFRAPIEVVAAGLLHAAYAYGDFGDGRRGIADRKRLYIRQAVGREVEEYVARYTILAWNIATSRAIRDRIATLDDIERHVVLMRLANHVEHLLDLGHRHSDPTFYIERNDPIMADIANKLGYPALAAELMRVSQENISSTLPAELSSHSDRVFVMPPRSCRRRLQIAVRQELEHAAHSLSSAVNRLRSAARVRTRLRELFAGLRRAVWLLVYVLPIAAI